MTELYYSLHNLFKFKSPVERITRLKDLKNDFILLITSSVFQFYPWLTVYRGKFCMQYLKHRN